MNPCWTAGQGVLPNLTVAILGTAARHLYGFGAQLSVRKWHQPPPLMNKNVAMVKRCQHGLKHQAKAEWADPLHVLTPPISSEIRHLDSTFSRSYVDPGPPPPATHVVSTAPPLAPSASTAVASLPAPGLTQTQCKKRKMDHMVSQPTPK
jgi:hypothetical protein